MRNREIKFRVWDTKQNKFLEEVPLVEEWIGADEWDDSEQISSNPFHWKNRPPFTDRLVWQQYTGAKDFKNKEIYEGDIVRTVEDHEAIMLFQPAQYTRGIITWLREAFCVCQETIGGNEMSNYVVCDCHGCALQVIGNIFENPELLDNGI